MSGNTHNVFSALSLSEYMSKSLPKEPSPQLRNSYDSIALLAHASMLAVGFRLVGLGEDHKIGMKAFRNLPQAVPLMHRSEASSDPNDIQPLPQEWNASPTSTYAFRYTHTQSSLQYLVKITRLGSKAVINGLAIDDEKVHTLDLVIKEFISESSFPYPPTNPEQETQTQNKDPAASIRNLFISPGRLTDAGSLLKQQIIQKLAPGLRKEGYEDSAHAASPNAAQNPRAQPASDRDPLRDDRLPPSAQPRPFHDPLAAEPRYPQPYPAGDFSPPGFEDEYEINRRLGRGMPGRNPLNIGERDLYPPGLGPNDPLRGGIGPGLGGIGGGGMHPTFDDPMFGRVGGVRGSQVPPGARYDPIGPGDGPPHLGFPGGGRGGRGAGGPPNPFGGFGDNDFI